MPDSKTNRRFAALLRYKGPVVHVPRASPRVAATAPTHTGTDPGAADRDHVRVLQSGELDATTTDALRHALFDRDLDAVRRLLNGGADPNATDDGGTALLTLASTLDLAEAVEELLRAGARTSWVDGSDQTALSVACIYGFTDVATRLLDARASTETTHTNDRYTPLIYAARNCHTDVVRVLLARGAAVDAPDDNGTPPLTWAAQGGNVETTRVLLDARANTSLRDRDGDSAVNVAMEARHTEVTQLLLRRGDVEAAAVRYFPTDTPWIQRGRYNHLKGLAVVAWTQKWDGLINGARIGNGYVTPPVENGGRNHVAIFTFFMPFHDLKWIVNDAVEDATGDGAYLQEESEVSVRRAAPDGEGGDYCPLRLRIGSDATKGDIAVDAVLEALNDRSREGDTLFRHVVERVSTALMGASQELAPRTVYRYIQSSDETIQIIWRMARGFTACSYEERIARRFCRANERDCTRLEIEVRRGTVGVVVDAALPREYRCYDEREMVLCPGITYVPLGESWEDGDGGLRTRVIRVGASGGLRPQIRTNYEGTWFH